MGKKTRGQPRVEVAPEAMERMVQAARVGAKWAAVAQLGDIEWETFRRWMREGREPSSPHAGFATRLTRARAEGQAMLLGRLMKLATEGDSRSITWLLDRVHQYDRGDADEKEITGAEVASSTDRLVDALVKLANGAP